MEQGVQLPNVRLFVTSAIFSSTTSSPSFSISCLRMSSGTCPAWEKRDQNHLSRRSSWAKCLALHLRIVGACLPAPWKLKHLLPTWLSAHNVPVLNGDVSYTQACETSARCLEIDLSQPRHETAFWWHHNGPVTSQLTDPIKLHNQPLELIEIFEHINTHNKESLTQRCRRSANVQLCLIFLYISIWFES